MHVCRFCHEYARDDQAVRYGRRHYAHHRCYLDAGRELSALPGWMVAGFPYRLLDERGLLTEAEQLVGGEDVVGTGPR